MNHALVIITVGLLFHAQNSQYIPYKSTTLSPFQDYQNGASALAIDGISLTNNNEWKFYTNTTSTPTNLLLNLDQTWSIHPTEPTILTIQLNGYIMNETSDVQLSFNVNNDYFNTKISLDNTQNNQISPICDSTANPSSTQMNHGNITSINYNPMNPPQMGGGFTNDFPLTFTLITTPNDSTIISYTSSSWSVLQQFCGFAAFEAQSDMNIYISSSELIISSIDLIHSIPTLTYNPSTYPTAPPTVIITTNDENITDPLSTNEDSMMFQYIIMALGVIICYCLILIFALIIKRKNNNKENDDYNPKPISIKPPGPKPSIQSQAAIPSNSILTTTLSSKYSGSATDRDRDNVPLPILSPTADDVYSYKLPIISSPVSMDRNHRIQDIQHEQKLQVKSPKERKIRASTIALKQDAKALERAHVYAEAVIDAENAQILANRAAQSFSFPGVAGNDKQKSALSESRETFIPPPPEVVFRSDWGKGLDKTVDGQGELIENIVHDMADSQLRLKVEKHFLSDAQREELQKQTPR